MTTFTESQIEMLREMGRDFAENEAGIWADQNSADNTNRPKEMPSWTRGTYEGDLDDIAEEDRFDAEQILDDAASARWAELAETFNASHDERVAAWKENQ